MIRRARVYDPPSVPDGTVSAHERDNDRLDQLRTLDSASFGGCPPGAVGTGEYSTAWPHDANIVTGPAADRTGRDTEPPR
jgi:hypothetical protein